MSDQPKPATEALEISPKTGQLVLPAEPKPATGEIEARITDYLAAGGLFNPELMEHEKVRDLLMACREALRQPNPTTGEWTAADVLQMGRDRADFAYAIADAHNAALADQKHDLWDKISLSRIEADNWKGLYEKYEKASVIRGQRADDAERALDLAIDTMIKENDQLKQQLAAAVIEERKRCAECGDIQSLTEELAAEREKVQ
jgi:hypothetical protein